MLGSFSALFMAWGWERHSPEWRLSTRQSGDWRSRGWGGKMGAAPRPDFGTDRHACFHRVLMDVRNGLIEVRLIADIAIPILAVPDGSAAGLAGVLQVIADFASRELLPRTDDLCDCPARHGLEEDMYVIWHYHPSEQTVPPRIKRQKRCLRHIGYQRVAQNARAVTGVDPVVCPPAMLKSRLSVGNAFKLDSNCRWRFAAGCPPSERSHAASSRRFQSGGDIRGSATCWRGNGVCRERHSPESSLWARQWGDWRSRGRA